MKEELQKSRSKVEELNNAKNDAEKNNSRLTSDLKAFREKSEKVSCPFYTWQTISMCEYNANSILFIMFNNNGTVLS